MDSLAGVQTSLNRTGVAAPKVIDSLTGTASAKNDTDSNESGDQTIFDGRGSRFTPYKSLKHTATPIFLWLSGMINSENLTFVSTQLCAF
jgi:hypothetical protein